MKKMTNKEFKEILNKAGMDFDVYGYEGILNMIAQCKRHYSEKHQEEGFEAISKMYLNQATYIHDELASRDYYK